MKRKIYILLIILFLSYAGMGGANSLLGSGWPAISADMAVPISWESIIIVAFYTGSAIGSAVTQNMLAMFRAWLSSVVSIVLLAIFVFVFSVTDSFVLMTISGGILGYAIGQGGTIINGYVARNYSATALSWAHCCYSIGCMLAPVALSYDITMRGSWRLGYQTIVIIELCILAILFISIPIWRVHGPVAPAFKKLENQAPQDLRNDVKVIPIRELLRLPGGTIIPVIILFYASFEMTTIFWATSFLTSEKHMTAGAAAGVMTFFFAAQVVGRAGGGFLALRFSDRSMIRVEIFVGLAATILLSITTDSMLVPVFMLLGLATGPIFPLLVHEVPSIVGDKNAQGVIGMQLAAAQVGCVIVPLLVGLLANAYTFKVLPIVLIILISISIALKLVQDRRYPKQEMKNENNS